MKRHRVPGLVVAAALAATFVPAAGAQEPDAELRREIKQLKRGQQAIKRELQEIKALLQARPSAPTAPNVKGKIFDLGDNPVKGASTARLTLVEFTDYQ